MDYEQEYKDALERAKDVPTMAFRDEEEVLRYIFPELAESEDERTRKEILNFILYKVGYKVNEETEHRWVAWLEKQKEVDMPDSTRLIEQWEAEKKMLEEKDFRGDEWRLAYNAFMDGFARGTCVKSEKQKEQKPADKCEGCNNYDACVTCVNGDCWAHIYDGAKPAEWSEEDEKVLNSIIKATEEGRLLSLIQLHWLKSLRPQPQRRDTYYDIIHNILATLKDMDFTKITPNHRISLLNDIRVKCKNADECAAILDEPHWKPSEEQMRALVAVTKNLFAEMPERHRIESLYNDLKKLTEE